MASPGNQDCANCIGALSFRMLKYKYIFQIEYTEACLPRLQRSTRRGWMQIIYYTSVDRNGSNSVTSICCMDLLYDLLLQLCSIRQGFD